MSSYEGPDVKELKKAGRALSIPFFPWEPERLAEVNGIRVARGEFAKRPLVDYTLYDIPEGMSEQELASVPFRELKVATYGWSTRRHLRLIAA